jgi:hypothetical protein
MFGIMNAYDGCTLFREAIQYHEDFYNWYKNMQILVASNDGANQNVILKQIKKNEPIVEVVEKYSDQGETAVPKIFQAKSRDDLITLRIVSLTYLIHLFSFAIASACKSSS